MKQPSKLKITNNSRRKVRYQRFARLIHGLYVEKKKKKNLTNTI